MAYRFIHRERSMSGSSDSAKTMATVVYVLQAIALFTGLPMFVAVILNYVKLDDVRGTWVESHFRWQIRTFWFSLLWLVVGLSTTWLLGVGFLVLFANFVWVLYRVIKGFVTLADKNPI